MTRRPKYTGDGATLLQNWVLLNDAVEFDPHKDGYPVMKKTRKAFYDSLDDVFARIKKHQRKPNAA